MTYIVTCSTIREANPCYDPSRYISEDYSQPLQVLLADSLIPAKDRVWVATKILDSKGLRIFALFCARRALECIANPDMRSITACDVAERFANGKATRYELNKAQCDLAAAATDIAYDLAAASAAASAYAASGTYAAATDAYAAYAASEDSASASAYTVSTGYNTAAHADARLTERENQCKWLIDYLDGEVTE